MNRTDGGDGSAGRKWDNPNKGKTYEEMYGSSEANRLKQMRSEVHKGKTVKNSTKQLLRNANLGTKKDQKFCETMSKIHKDKKWYNDGIKSYHITSEKTYLISELNLVEGRLMNKSNLRFTTSTKNCIRITDGVRNRTIKSDDSIPDGWRRGQTKKK